MNQKFTGQERDSGTVPNLDYFYARYFNGEQGRFLSPDPENAGADPMDPQSWNGYSYGLSNPFRFIDPDGRDTTNAQDFCHENPNCVTVTAKAPSLSTVDEFLSRSLANVIHQSRQIQRAGQQVFNWLSQPRNGSCLAASTASGASAGAGVGMLGLAGGPAVGIIEPSAMAIGGGIGWAGGMVSCMSSSASGGAISGGDGGGGASSESASDSSKPPINATKLRGNQGWRDENGNIWKKDMLHKDHWDISDR